MSFKMLSQKSIDAAQRSRESVTRRFSNLRPGDNTALIIEKLSHAVESGRSPTYVECGVFTGGAFMTIKDFLDSQGTPYSMYGVDSFEGFPAGVVNSHDHPENFLKQHSSGQISDLVLEMARSRTSGLSDASHLTGEYFRRDDLIEMHKERLAGQSSASIVVGAFSTSLDSLKCSEIDVLFLDCDLYESYLICLEKLFDRIVPGGAVVFDEVYSYKYPGARDAVFEFFESRMHLGSFEVYQHPAPFERWCFVRSM